MTEKTENSDKWKDIFTDGKIQNELVLYENQCAPKRDLSRCPAAIEKPTLKVTWKCKKANKNQDALYKDQKLEDPHQQTL